MKKYLIFDFDGLILDTEYAWYQAYQKWFLDHFDFKLDEQLFVSCVGTTNHQFLRECSKLLNTDIDPKEFKEETNKTLHKLCAQLPLMEGLNDVLEYAKQRGIVCSIISNSPKSWSIPHLIRNNILDDFDLIVTPLSRKEMKPSGTMYKRILDYYDCIADDVLVLEDSPSGLESAKKMEIEVVIIENKLTKYMDFQGVFDYKLKSLKEVVTKNLI